MGLFGWVGVGLGRNMWLQVWYLICSYFGVVFNARLVSLTSSSYPSPCSPSFFETIVLWKYNLYLIRRRESFDI